jgi:hypothetical protein
MGRSIVAAMAPLFAQQSAKKLKLKAAPGDLSAPRWSGELEVASQPDKLVLFEAARVKYVATCALTEHVPTPLHQAFDVLLVPTLRRWLGMPKGTALCVDWVALTPSLDAAIMPLLRSKFTVVSAMSLRASLKALRIRAFTSSWLDLNRAFDSFSALWDVAVFEAHRHGVSLPSPDLADILKAACSEVPCLADTIEGRQDDVLLLETAVRSFLEREEARALDPSQAKTQRPPVDSRRSPSVSFARPSLSPSAPPARVPVPQPSQSPSRPKSPAPASHRLLAVAAEVLQGVCCNCGLSGHSANDCVTAELFPALGKGPSGVWRKGEREAWVKSLPPDTVAAIVAGVRKKMAAKKARNFDKVLPVSPRRAPSSVNAPRYPSFEARARVGSREAVATPALADTGTPPNFVSAELAASIVRDGMGTFVPVHVRISAAGVFRGECRKALRTHLWCKVRGVWVKFDTDLLIFETGQPLIIGYISLVEWGWISIDGPVARYKTPSASRSQLTGWLHGLHAAGPRDSVSLCAVAVSGVSPAVPEAEPAPVVLEGRAEPLLSRLHRRWNAPRPPRVAVPGRVGPAQFVAPPVSDIHRKEKTGSRLRRVRVLAGRSLAGCCSVAAGVAFAPVSALPALAVLLFVLGVVRAVPVLAREVQGAADLLPSRFKGGWPQRSAARRAERAQAAALQGLRYGSVVCDAVGGAAAAVKRAVVGAASSAASAVLTGAAEVSDALPSRYKGAWARRATQRKEERMRATEAAATPKLPKPEEKSRARTFSRAVRPSERIKGAPASVMLSVMTGQLADKATADFWATPEMKRLERDLRKLEAEYGKADGTRIFSKDLSVPSKMRKMRVRMREGWQEGMRRQRPRHFSPPQEAWIEDQTMKMIKNKILSRAGPNAFVSCLHLAKKKAAPCEAESKPKWGAVNVAYLAVCERAARTFGGSLQGVVPPEARMAERAAMLLAMEAPVFCEVDAQTRDRTTGVAHTWRFCIDLREVNKWTVSESYPTPDIRKCLDRLVGNRIFGSIDCSAMYHQIELEEGSKNLIAFSIPGSSRGKGGRSLGSGLWRAERVQFGMRNACQHAQEAFNQCIRSDARLDSVQNYLDDAALAARTPAEFLVLVRAFFEMCETFNIKLNAAKTVLGVPELKHLGFVVNEHGCKVDADRIRVLTHLPRPRTVKQVQALVGAFNFVRAWVPRFSTVASPLTGMKVFSWGAEEEASLVALQAAVASSGMLYCLDYTRAITLRCDASAVGCGGVLLQRDELGRERPIAWVSKKFSAVERRWNTVEAEAFAIVWSLQKLRQFVQGCPICIETDSKNVRYINSATASNKVTRWRMILDEHEYTIAHIPGKTNSVDAVSRLVANAVPDAEVSSTLREEWLGRNVECLRLGVSRGAPDAPHMRLPGLLTTANRGAQQAAVVRWLSSGGLVSLCPIAAAPAEFERITGTARYRCLLPCSPACAQPIADGSRHYHTQRYHSGAPAPGVVGAQSPLHAAAQAPARQTSHPTIRGVAAGEHFSRPILNPVFVDPPGMTDAVRMLRAGGPPVQWTTLDEASRLLMWDSVHNSLEAGHLGAQPCFERLCRSPFLLMQVRGEKEALHRSCVAFRSACLVCQARRNRDLEPGDVALSAIPAAPWAEISVDTLLIKPVDADGNTHIVVVTDNWTKWTRLEPIKCDDSPSVALAVLRATDGRSPVSIRSDNGPSYAGAVMESLAFLLGASRSLTVPHVHTGNSVVERSNKEVLKHVSNLVLCQDLRVSAFMTWGALCPLVQNIINTSFHSGIGMAPAQLWFGRDAVDCAHPLLAPAPVAAMPGARFPFADWAQRLADNQVLLCAAAHAYASARRAKALGKRSRDGGRIFSVGQLVWVRWPADMPQPKIAGQWDGPQKVVSLAADGLVAVVEDPVKLTVRDVSLNDMLPVDMARLQGLSEDALQAHVRLLSASKQPSRSIAKIVGWRRKCKLVGWVGLPADFRRGHAEHLSQFQFLVRWVGEQAPTIESYDRVRLAPVFDDFLLSVVRA